MAYRKKRTRFRKRKKRGGFKKTFQRFIPPRKRYKKRGGPSIQT